MRIVDRIQIRSGQSGPAKTHDDPKFREWRSSHSKFSGAPGLLTVPQFSWNAGTCAIALKATGRGYGAGVYRPSPQIAAQLRPQAEPAGNATSLAPVGSL